MAVSIIICMTHDMFNTQERYCYDEIRGSEYKQQLTGDGTAGTGAASIDGALSSLL